MPYVTVEVDVDLDEFSDKELIDECKKRAITAAVGNADASEAGLVVERAFLACRARTDLPQELKDMFWKVHDRAMP